MNSRSPQPSLINFRDTVWRLCPDPVSKILVAETRNRGSQSTAGFSIPLRSPQSLPMSLPQSWWISLTAAHDHRALWQRYEDEGLPVPLGMYAVELGDGGLAWQHPTLKFTGLAPEVALGIDPQTPQLTHLIDWRNGNIRETLETSQLPQDLIRQFDASRFATIHFPNHLLPDKVPQQKKGPVSELQTPRFKIRHHYQRAGNSGWTATLSITDPDDHLLAYYAAGTYPDGFGMDPFLLIHDWLVWLVPPSQVAILDLTLLTPS